MPLPLAHPAAVLPLRRFCPRYFSFAALIVGSLAPDFAYSIDDLNKFSVTVTHLLGSSAADLTCVTEQWDWDDFSHTFLGSFGFCLPAGLLFLYLLHILRHDLAALLPNPHRDAVARWNGTDQPTFARSVISLLIGIWLHIAWDSFTNGGRWFGHHLPFLHLNVINFGGRHLEFYRAFWWLSTVGGTLALALAYIRSLKAQNHPLASDFRSETRYYLFGLGALLAAAMIALPLALKFNQPGPSLQDFLSFGHRFVGYFLVALSIVVLAAAISLRVYRSRKAA